MVGRKLGDGRTLAGCMVDAPIRSQSLSPTHPSREHSYSHRLNERVRDQEGRQAGRHRLDAAHAAALPPARRRCCRGAAAVREVLGQGRGAEGGGGGAGQAARRARRREGERRCRRSVRLGGPAARGPGCVEAGGHGWELGWGSRVCGETIEWKRSSLPAAVTPRPMLTRPALSTRQVVPDA